MKLFDVYPLFDITPVKAEGSWLWDEKGEKYLDLYGGHAVISIGHSHPQYVKMLSDQLGKISFYSNSVQNPQQQQLAEKVGVTRQTIIAMEQDKYSPSLELAFRIAHVFGVPLEEVFTYQPEDSKE